MQHVLHASILQHAAVLNIRFFQLIIKLFLLKNQRRGLWLRSAFVGLFLFHSAFAAFEETAIGGKSGGVAGAAAASAWGAESIFYNPAGLFTAGRFALVTAAYRPFELADVQAGLIAVSLTGGRTAVGVGAALFGNPLYRETQPAVAAAFRFKPFDLTVGAAVRWGYLAVRSYGNAAAVTFDAGMQAALTSGLFWGAALSNIAGATIGRCKEPLPQSLRFGWIFQPRQELSFHTELYKDDRFPLDLRLGISCRPLSALEFRAGAAGQPRRYSLGFSLYIGGLRFDYDFMNHLELGPSHLVGFGRE